MKKKGRRKQFENWKVTKRFLFLFFCLCVSDVCDCGAAGWIVCVCVFDGLLF